MLVAVNCGAVSSRTSSRRLPSAHLTFDGERRSQADHNRVGHECSATGACRRCRQELFGRPTAEGAGTCGPRIHLD